ncbi:MAG: hypothetical protein AAF489_05590 [Bacteroidota bacterium]
MTSDLRKAHKIIWMMLLLTVPVALVFAVLEIRTPVIHDNDLVLSEAPSGSIVLDNESFSMSINKVGEIHSLQVVVKRPLKSPSAVIYGTTSEENREYFVGTIAEKGVYDFQLNDGTKGIRIYDAIKEKDIINTEL